MKTTRSFFIMTIGCVMTTNSFAQEKDLANINYGVSKLTYNDSSANAKQFEARFRLPVYQKNKSVIAGAIGYKNLSLNKFPDGYTHSLHAFILQGAWQYKLSANRSIAVLAQAGLFSDLEDISSEDFRYSVGFRYRYKHSPRLATGWGIAYSRQFFGNQIIPFIDVDYQPNKKWSITGQFPVKPKILYHFNQRVSAGIEISGEAASYRLSAGEKSSQFMQMNQWAALAKLEYRFADSWQFNLAIGRNLKQSFRLYDDASTAHWTIITIPIGEKPDPVHTVTSSGMNLQMGISFSLPDR